MREQGLSAKQGSSGSVNLEAPGQLHSSDTVLEGRWHICAKRDGNAIQQVLHHLGTQLQDLVKAGSAILLLYAA